MDREVEMGRRPLRALAPAALLLAVAVAGCNLDHLFSPIMVSEPNPNADISGEWAFAAFGSTYGSLFLTVNGASLGGSGTLAGYDQFGTFTITQGSKNGATITFVFAGCSFTGTVRGTDTAYLGGQATCSLGPGGVWSGNRPTPPIQITWPLAARTMVVGGTLVPPVAVQDAHGRRLGRALTVSSDNPSVASVSSAGVVSAVGSGTATITLAATEARSTIAITSVGLVRFASVSAGSQYSCGITAEGLAFCWGSGGYLGDGSTVGSTSPIGVAEGLTWRAIDLFTDRACGITTAGTPYCWGRGQAPVIVGTNVFYAISAGATHACALADSGSAYCWGPNYGGELGDGTMTASVTPVPVTGGFTFTAISAGMGHSCALTADSAAYCWGGSLGAAPVRVVGGPHFASISDGASFTCGLTAAGAAWCWGSNFYGQLGNGTTANSASPTPVSGGLVFSALSAGIYGPCGLTTDGKMYCWGFGLLDNTISTVPRAAPAGPTFVSLSAGETHACGLATDGAVYCWGSNGNGELGDGTTTKPDTPVRVIGQQ